MRPLISVIIPAYNIENYIERCLKSVCEQTYTNLEIIVIDDGSKDRTREIIDKIAQEDSRIIPIHKENAGVSAARNTGLDKATGDYIGFVDGDDVIEKDMYEFLLENAVKYDADISHCGYQMVFPSRIDYYYNTGEVRIQDNYQGVFDLVKADKIEPGIWNKLYRRELLCNIYLDESIRINEDFLFNYYVFRRSNKAVYEDSVKYSYMIRANSASTSSLNEHKLRDPFRVLEIMMQNETGEIYKLLEKRYFYLLEKISVRNDLNNAKMLKEYQYEKRQELKKVLREKDFKAEYSSKEMFQLKLAANCPEVYRLIHEIYALMTGSRNKYKV